MPTCISRICPLCGGDGLWPNTVEDEFGNSTPHPNPGPCPGCGGNGKISCYELDPSIANSLDAITSSISRGFQAVLAKLDDITNLLAP